MRDDHLSAARQVPRPRSLTRRLRRAGLMVGCVASITACHDEQRIAGQSQTPPPAGFPAMAVSDTTSNAAAGGGTAAAVGAITFVSLPPGAIPDGLRASITNHRTGANLSIPLVDGGFDPVPLEAVAGDVLDIVVNVSGSTPMQFSIVVPLRSRPRVVRTEPPPHKRDVPLNRIMVVVFSEPIEPNIASNGGIQLRHGSQAVPGHVERSANGLIATFIPDDSLQANSDYQLIVGEGVRDLDGDALESPVVIEFTTAAAPPPTIPLVASRISAGWSHTCALDSSGAAFCWGSNDGLQLGNGNTSIRVSSTPLGVSGGHTFESIVAGGAHTCGLTSTGEALCWGSAYDSSVPIAVAGSYRFAALASGWAHTCGLVSSGAAYCWGANDDGQLGDGHGPSPFGYGQFTPMPVAVLGALTYTAITAGGGHTCALDRFGAAWCWGANNDGQLGIGSSNFSSSPAAVLGGLTFTAIAAGVRHTCGLVRTGAAYCWGANADGGQLGDGTRTSSPRPVAVAGGLTFVAITAGGFHTCGITGQGLSYCWGLNTDGQLGTGSQTNQTSALPVAINHPPFTALSGGLNHTCGITASAAVYCWGDNTVGEVGNGVHPWTAAPIIGLSSAAVVQAGTNHSCALDGSGAAFCWGDNAFGQLGTSSTARSATPVAVAGGLRFSTLSSQRHHSCGLTSSGAAYCWGLNQFGALGDGSTTNRYEPVAVSGGLRFTTLDVGSYHTCGIVSSGAAYCWGHGTSGELGTGLGGSSDVPVAVAGGLRFAVVAAGASFSCGLTLTGAAYCWGLNLGGMLGDGSLANRFAPVAVSGGLNFTALTVGLDHSCGLTSTGTGYCWGGDWFGELGNGQVEVNIPQPVSVFGGQRFDALSAGYSFTCGLASVGAPLCWGYNWQSQLGNGAFTNSVLPVAVSGGPSFRAITTGEYHACGVTAAGTVYCWGENHYGQLGRGRYGYEPVPVAIGPFTASASAAFLPSSQAR